MATPYEPTPIPNAPHLPATTRKPKSILWKWSVGITVVVVGFLLWQCGAAVMNGRQLSNAAVQNFHAQLNAEKYDEIFDRADDAFRRSGDREDTIKFLRAVHTKLGDAKSPTLTNVMVQTNSSGTFVITTYTTPFERGEAVEKFTWSKKGQMLLLRRYNVQSTALVVG